MKLKKGFELFKTRSTSDQIPFDDLESKLGFDVPPLYKCIIKHLFFDTKRNGFYYKKYGEVKSFLSQKCFGLGFDDVGLINFMNLNKLSNII